VVSRNGGEGFAAGDLSAADLTAAEWSRLCDYTADALDPADADEVGRLVAVDPRWIDAYADLTMAGELVDADLRLFANEAAPMPTDVSTRIDAALREMGDQRPTVVASLDSARTRRINRRRLTVAGLAASVVGIAAAGIALSGQWQTTTTQSVPLGDAPANVPSSYAQSGSSSFPGSPTILVSGRNYVQSTLPQIAVEAQFSADTSKDSAASAPRAAAGAELAPGRLSRLASPEALEICLNSIRAVHSGTVTTIDFASYSGQPALVVLVRQGSTNIVVAVGPDCGLIDSDEKAVSTRR
jgi:hypothetical protein